MWQSQYAGLRNWWVLNKYMSTDDNDNCTQIGHYRECYMIENQYKE